MNFFKNRFVAGCLLFAAIFGITPAVAQGQLDHKVSDVETGFYEYKGIGDRLESRSDAAENLVSIAVNYPELVTLTEALRFAQEELYDCLWSDDLDDLYEANAEMEPAFQALYRALCEQDLSDTDKRAVESYSTTFNGAQRMIDASDYNDRVASFRKNTYNRFPARQIADWFDIDPPEFYGEPDTDHGESHDIPVIPDVPDVPDVPDAPDLDEIIDHFTDGLSDYIEKTVSDSLETAFD